MSQQNDIVIMPGVWRHYKGGAYRVIITDAIYAETGEQLIIYMDHTGMQVYARTRTNFLSEVNLGDGYWVPRFVRISDL